MMCQAVSMVDQMSCRFQMRDGGRNARIVDEGQAVNDSELVPEQAGWSRLTIS